MKSTQQSRKLSRQQKILVRYLYEGSMTTFEIGKRFLYEHGGIWYDLRKRASELKALGLLDSDKKTPSTYWLTEKGKKKYELVSEPNYFRMKSAEKIDKYQAVTIKDNKIYAIKT